MRGGERAARVVMGALCALVVVAPVLAQEADAVQEAAPRADVLVALRVTAQLAERRASIDRGSSDGLVVGDVVWLTPREGGRFRATVLSVDERSAVIEVTAAGYNAVVGTRGEAFLPAVRFDAVVDPIVPVEPPTESGSQGDATDRPTPAWQRGEDGFTTDMPLLAGARAILPGDRQPFVVGRVFVGLDGTLTSEDGRSSLLERVGADMSFENAFGRGETLDVAVEFERLRFDRTELDDLSSTELRIERLSYRTGGTRFESDRLQGGRFLQYGTPEFGVLDGAEWSRRVDEHHQFGTSLGFMPEPDADYDSGHDFQIAGWYRWTSDATEIASAQVGFQKTWHNGAPDRDLLVLKGHYLPRYGWNTFANLWLDFYSAGDEIKGAGPAITQIYVSTSPYTAQNYGLDFTYSYHELPELERNEFGQVVDPLQIGDERVHRLNVDLWLPIGERVRWIDRAGIWDDADETGGDFEAGVEIDGVLGRGSRLRPIYFISAGDFTDVWGTRLALSFGSERFAYDLFYELANYDQAGFAGDNDDFVQHRLRTNLTWRQSERLSVSTYVDGTLFNSESGVTAGVFAQWSF